MKYKVVIVVEVKRTPLMQLRHQIRSKVNELADALVGAITLQEMNNKGGTK